jgi:alcohol dehydrogenase class IV
MPVRSDECYDSAFDLREWASGATGNALERNMKSFVYDQPSMRVIFGIGSVERLPDEVENLGARRALVLSTPEQAEDARRTLDQLGANGAGTFTEAVMHVPVETVSKAMEVVAALGADCTVAIGGGSTIGLAKAIALEAKLPIVAVPTTYAGSEMTPIYGLTDAGLKKTGRDSVVRPRTVIYDPTLTVTMPAKLSGTSGMNAMAHCLEGLYAENRNPIMTLFAAEGIRALSRSLPIVVREPENLGARSDAQYGAWLSGAVLGNVGMALHHKLCHTLGGTFNLPHAEVHTVILPYAARYNREAAAEAMRIAAGALGAPDAAQGIYDLSVRLGAPTSLNEIGMPEDGLDKAADLATTNPYYNPRPVERDAIRQLLADAFVGKRPE